MYNLHHSILTFQKWSMDCNFS